MPSLSAHLIISTTKIIMAQLSLFVFICAFFLCLSFLFVSFIISFSFIPHLVSAYNFLSRSLFYSKAKDNLFWFSFDVLSPLILFSWPISIKKTNQKTLTKTETKWKWRDTQNEIRWNFNCQTKGKKPKKICMHSFRLLAQVVLILILEWQTNFVCDTHSHVCICWKKIFSSCRFFLLCKVILVHFKIFEFSLVYGCCWHFNIWYFIKHVAYLCVCFYLTTFSSHIFVNVHA